MSESIKSIILMIGILVIIIFAFKALIEYFKYKKKKLSNTIASNNYKILRDIIKTVFTKGKSMKEACDIIIGILRTYYPIDYITIFEYDSDQRSLEILSTNIDKVYTKDIENYADEVFREMKGNDGSIVVGNTSDTILQYPTAGVNDRRINYMFMIPLTTTETTVGALLIENKATNECKKVEQPYLDEELFRVITNNITIVLENFIYNQKIATMATTDGLTGVYNRHYLEQMLDKEIEKHKENKTEFSITLIDVDKFKPFNDTHGHLFGDYVLKQTAAALKSFTSKGCVATRFGGEEFVVYIPTGDKEEAKQIVEEMRVKVADMQLKKDDGTIVTVTASFGISNYPKDATDKNNLLKNADNALYYAKDNGRNRVVYFGDLNESDYSKFVLKNPKMPE